MINGRKITALRSSIKFKSERVNKEMPDYLHSDKIRLIDEIFAINKGGHIGESAKREIEFAKSLGKPIRYLE